ncbi:protein FAR1-RELATED SEQUENCE 5-like [Quercus robur]|uniref:protein FAR1-RELATED SEQUENCE 5-like n=1 Tax=Quercus robur TaxID=38942 RepID=UPI0021627EDD|nr:protein FAR1-RELATED SEQUENCE 5-like [Quercus robur]
MDVNADLNPTVGMEFDTSEDACDFWVKYGRQMGFDVRKLYINKSKKDGNVTLRGFVCVKQGIRETVYMMRSQRKISEVHARLIELASSSGIKPKAVHELMSKEAGGRANFGFIELDHKNYLRTRWQKNLIYGQAACLLRYFQEQWTKNPFLQYGVQLDNIEQRNYLKWLFESFLVAHASKRPKTIFTDQDLAMAKALNEDMQDLSSRVDDIAQQLCRRTGKKWC